STVRVWTSNPSCSRVDSSAVRKSQLVTITFLLSSSSAAALPYPVTALGSKSYASSTPVETPMPPSTRRIATTKSPYPGQDVRLQDRMSVHQTHCPFLTPLHL